MTNSDESFEQLLVLLKETRGFDFSGYKRTTLVRRVQRRMSDVGLETYDEYVDFLLVHPEEYTALFNTILINVTSFFRDADAWEYLATEIVPELLAKKATDDAIRIWSAGCASGEEPYTLAIMLAELLGPDEFRDRVKIYATDVDDEALDQARQGSFGERDLEPLDEDLRTRYFEQQGQRFHFRKDLRRSVIFGRNDLVQDAPISRIDLLVCRNTLMYFNAETQTRVLTRFNFALRDGGFLFLGKAEMLLSHGNLFTPVDLKRRMFRKVPNTLRERFQLLEHGAGHAPNDDTIVGLDPLREEALAASPVAEVVLNADGFVALVNRQAERMFGISGRDVGRPLRDLELSYRPIELRSHVEQVQVDRRSFRIPDVEWIRSGGEKVYLDIQVNPLVETGGRLLGVSLVFVEVTASHRLQEDLELLNRQLETAYEELQSTNEELETTNEELQSTVEELETTNEELQSTNEELETMNEELQSTNDELQVINDELRKRSQELDHVNDFLESILAGLRSGVMVIDDEMRIQVWNREAEDLWGLRREEVVGQHLLNLDIGLPVDKLRPIIRDAMADPTAPTAATIPAVNRRGREVLVRVVGSVLRGSGSRPMGTLIVMDVDDARPRAALDGAAADGAATDGAVSDGHVSDWVVRAALDGAALDGAASVGSKDGDARRRAAGDQPPG